MHMVDKHYTVIYNFKSLKLVWGKNYYHAVKKKLIAARISLKTYNYKLMVLISIFFF